MKIKMKPIRMGRDKKRHPDGKIRKYGTEGKKTPLRDRKR